MKEWFLRGFEGVRVCSYDRGLWFWVVTSAGKGLVNDCVKTFNELIPESYSQLYRHDVCFFVIQYNRSCSDHTVVFNAREITNVDYPLYLASIECREL